MSTEEYTLSNTAALIDAALTRVVSADTSPTAASQNMVTSGGVKAAIDDIGSGSSAIVTTASFTDTALEDSTESLTATDTAIPTSKAVKDYVDNSSLPYNRLYIKMYPSDFSKGQDSGDLHCLLFKPVVF